MSFILSTDKILTDEEWRQLRGTHTIEEMINNRVKLEFREHKTLDKVYDIATASVTGLLFVKHPHDLVMHLYFLNPVDRSRFLTELARIYPDSPES